MCKMYVVVLSTEQCVINSYIAVYLYCTPLFLASVSFSVRCLFQMLPNTNPKSREHDFHKLFKSLPEGETLIQGQ